MDIEVRYLDEVPSALRILAQWFRDEWEPYYGPAGHGDAGHGDAEADLKACCQRDELPIGLVAVSGEGQVLGTIALKSTSISHEYLRPWGAAFLVGKGHRRQGVGYALIAALEDVARRHGFESVYMSTDGAANLVERRGWRQFDKAESLRGPVRVYEKHLQS